MFLPFAFRWSIISIFLCVSITIYPSLCHAPPQRVPVSALTVRNSVSHSVPPLFIIFFFFHFRSLAQFAVALFHLYSFCFPPIPSLLQYLHLCGNASHTTKAPAPAPPPPNPQIHTPTKNTIHIPTKTHNILTNNTRPHRRRRREEEGRKGRTSKKHTRSTETKRKQEGDAIAEIVCTVQTWYQEGNSKNGETRERHSSRGESNENTAIAG